MILSRFPILETERCNLRQLVTSDAEVIFTYFSDEIVMQYYGLEPFTRIEQAEQFLVQIQNGMKNGSLLRWGIETKENNKLIGTIGFHNWSKMHHRAEIGYDLNRSDWNKGIMTEVLQKIITYAFYSLGLNRIGATVRKENIASCRILQKLGFKEEGNLHEYQYYLGKYYDLLMFGLVQGSFLGSFK